MSDFVPCFLPRVAARSTSEDSLTEALAHVLEFSDGFRERVATCLWSAPDSSAEPKLQTQRGGEAGGRVDIRWISGSRRAIIECKLESLFSPNQPTAYLKELHSRADSVLLLIAPSNRLRALCTEAITRLAKEPLFVDVTWNEPSATTNGFTGRADHVRLVALPWVTLSQWLREESGKISGRLAFQLEETAAVMDTYDHTYGPAPTLLCAPSLAGEVRDIQFIVSWAHEYVYQIPGITVSPLRGGDDQGLCYGFKIMLSRGHDPADVLEFWFGLWFLTEHSGSCVFLGGYGPSREWLASKHMGGRPLRSGYWVVPFPLYGAWTEIKERLGMWLSDLLSYVAG